MPYSLGGSGLPFFQNPVQNRSGQTIASAPEATLTSGQEAQAIPVGNHTHKLP